MTSMNAGVWIDHRKAMIVLLGEGEQSTAVIESSAEKHLERSGDSPLNGPYEARQVPADDKRQRMYTGELDHYYDRVIAALQHADSLLIVGPGEAKIEFRKRLDHQHLGGRVSAVQTTDKLTERQLAAKAWEYFSRLSVR